MKKITSLFMTFVMVLLILVIPNYRPDAATLSIALSATSVNVGEQVVVTVTVPAGHVANVKVNYSADMLSYVSANTSVQNSSGVITMTAGEYGSKNTKVAITFNAIAGGTAKVTAQATSASTSAGGATLDAAGVKIQVNGQGPSSEPGSEPLLSSLSLSKGTLSPAFQPNTTEYTATVDYNITEVDVTAVAQNASDKVSSISGNTNLNVGENTIEIIVKGTNGTTKTYKIYLTRLEEGQGNEEVTFEIEGEVYYPSAEIPQDVIPDGFALSSALIGNKMYAALPISDSGLAIIYLVDKQGANGALYVCDTWQLTVVPFVVIKNIDGYIIPIYPQDESAVESLTGIDLFIGGKGPFCAYQNADMTDEYLIYAVNSSGESNWYLYNDSDGSYVIQKDGITDLSTQTPVTEESEESDPEKKVKRLKVINGVLIAIVIILVIIIALFSLFFAAIYMNRKAELEKRRVRKAKYKARMEQLKLREEALKEKENKLLSKETTQSGLSSRDNGVYKINTDYSALYGTRNVEQSTIGTEYAPNPEYVSEREFVTVPEYIQEPEVNQKPIQEMIPEETPQFSQTNSFGMSFEEELQRKLELELEEIQQETYQESMESDVSMEETEDEKRMKEFVELLKTQSLENPKNNMEIFDFNK